MLSCLSACNRPTTPTSSEPANREDASVPVFLRDLSKETAQAMIRGANGEILTDLYRDMTPQSGIDFTYRNGQEANHFAILESLGGGVALLDYDGDGLLDIFVTGGGYFDGPDRHDIKGHGNRLYKNLGGWKFRDVTKEVGVDQPAFYTHGCAVADYNRDGWPDLLVTGWGRVVLYRNEPDGKGGRRFTDVSREAGLTEALWSTSAAWADLDGDGNPDIYVANDTVDNFLYINQSTPGHLRFEEVGLPSGVARDERGVPNGSMGTDAADYDGTGRPSLWCTNYENEMHALYRNLGKGMFFFSTPASGIAAIGQSYVGFGTGFVDLDNHGYPDLAIANGHVIRFPGGSGVRQRPVLLRNKGNGRFVDISRQGGTYFRSEHIGRGVAIGDLDNDGRPDLVISHLNEPVVLLRNETNVGNHWQGIELLG